MIDYTSQAAGRIFTTFGDPLDQNKIVLFITSLWIQGTSGVELKIHITPSVLNSSHYQWVATAFSEVKLTRFQFSQIIFNQADV